MTTARLGFDIDSGPLKAGKADLEALVPAAKRAETAADGLSSSFNTASTSVKASTTEIQKAVDGLDKTGTSLKGAASGADALSEELLQLRNRFNPLYAATEKYEQELRDIARAEKLAAISAEEGAAARQRATASFRSLQASMGSAGGGFGSLTSQIQNASFQIGDFATQVGAGTSAAQALGQQLPQLAGGFGVWGAAVGAALAIAIPLGAALLDIGANAGSLEDQIDDLSEAIDDLRDAQEASRESLSSLREEYGRFAEQAAGVLAQIEEIARLDALEGLRGTAKSISEEFGTLSDNLARIEYDRGITPFLKIAERVESQLDLNSEAALEFADALVAVGGAEGAENIARELARVQSILLENVGSAEDLKGEAAEFYREVTNARNEALRLAGAMDETTNATNAAVSAASNLAGEYANAYAQFQNIMQAEKQRQADLLQSNADFADDLVNRANARLGYGNPNFGAQNDIGELGGVAPRPVRAPRVARSGGGSRGGKSEAEREAERLAEAYDKVTESLEHEIETFGLSEVAQRAANEARKAGVDLASEQGQSISALVYELDALETKQRQVEAVNQFVAESFADLFTSAIQGADDFNDALSNLLGQLGQMAINQGFQSLFAGVGNTQAGGIFSSIFGVGAAPNANGNAFDRGNVIPFASGGIVDRPTLFPMANGAGLMGEAGPEAIMPLKRGADGKLGVASSGGKSASITFNIDAKGADATQIAALQAQLKAMQQTLPAQIKSYLDDPRMAG